MHSILVELKKGVRQMSYKNSTGVNKKPFAGDNHPRQFTCC